MYSTVPCNFSNTGFDSAVVHSKLYAQMNGKSTLKVEVMHFSEHFIY